MLFLWRLPSTILLSVLLTLFIPTSLSINCYRCDSLQNPHCLKSDHYLSIPVIACPWDDAACFRTDTWVNFKGKFTKI